MNILRNQLLVFLFSIFIKISFAGSCCSGPNTATPIITGSSIAAFRAIYNDKTLLADIDSSNLELRTTDKVETVRTLNLSTNYKISNKFQLGLLAPIVEKTKYIDNRYKSESGLGDIQINAAYEWIEELTRTQLISQNFLYSSLTLPSSPSIFSSDDPYLMDTRGSGHYVLGVGSIFIKRWTLGTTSLDISISFRPSREFKSSTFVSINSKNSLNNRIILSQTIDFTDQFELILGISRAYEESTAISPNISSLLTTSFLTVNYATENYSLSLGIADDFLARSSYNQVLGNTINIGVIRNFQ